MKVSTSQVKISNKYSLNIKIKCNLSNIVVICAQMESKISFQLHRLIIMLFSARMEISKL